MNVVNHVNHMPYLGRLLLGDAGHVADQLQVPLDIPAVDVGLRTNVPIKSKLGLV